jgi:hypothetical protein
MRVFSFVSISYDIRLGGAGTERAAQGPQANLRL